MLPSSYLGKTIGPYQVLSRLGKGGMGTVWHARHSTTGEEVALKVLAGTVYEGEDSHKRFLVETEALSRLKHPGLVRLISAGPTEDGLYFSMELIEGTPLSNLIRWLPPTNVAAIVAQVAEALQYVHKQDCIHRDVKPSNILIDLDGRALLSDFGVVRIGGSQMTQAGALIGTPAFMSPELAGGEGDIDGRTDIYALGAVLYKALSKQSPYTGKSAFSIVRKILEGPPPKPSEVAPDVDPALERICLRAMARDRDERYPLAISLAADLKAYVRRSQKAPDVARQQHAAVAAGATSEHGERRSRVVPVLLVLVLSLFVGLGATAFLYRNELPDWVRILYGELTHREERDRSRVQGLPLTTWDELQARRTAQLELFERLEDRAPKTLRMLLSADVAEIKRRESERLRLIDALETAKYGGDEEAAEAARSGLAAEALRPFEE